MPQLVFASRILYFVVLGLARVSAVLFIRQLFTKHLRPQWISCNVMLALVGCWSVLAICLASAGCSATDALESRFYLNSVSPIIDGIRKVVHGLVEQLVKENNMLT